MPAQPTIRGKAALLRETERPDPGELEAPFTDRLIRVAGALGWRRMHPRPARTRDGGWRTAVQGDSGWPDLVLVRAPRLVIAELKTARGRYEPGQREWLAALEACFDGTDAEVYVVTWRPADWDAIISLLE